jgi:hypothetical protein
LSDLGAKRFFWTIVASPEYIDDVKDLPIEEQEKFFSKWTEVARHQDPSEVGSVDSCGTHAPYLKVIFPELLTYSFTR